MTASSSADAAKVTRTVRSLTPVGRGGPTVGRVPRSVVDWARAALRRLRSTGEPVLRIWEDPDALGYVLGPDPLLDVLPAEQWRALERRALAAVRG